MVFRARFAYINQFLNIGTDIKDVFCLGASVSLVRSEEAYKSSRPLCLAPREIMNLNYDEKKEIYIYRDIII